MTRPSKGYRSSPKGSYMLDREIRGVGRIHMASGLSNAAQFRVLNDGITDLATSPAGLDVLRALKARSLTPLTLFGAIKANTTATLAVGAAARPLLTALATWREAYRTKVATRTYEVRGELIAHLTSVVTPTTPIAGLPAALRVLKETMRGARSFNLDLAYASAFVRDTLGRRHPLYLDVRDIDPLAVSATTERRPLTPQDVLTLAQAFDRVWQAKRGSRGDEVLAMALTGMGPTEYWGAWSVRDHHVHIDGTKRVARVRDIPKLFPCAIYDRPTLARPSITVASFARALHIARVATGIDCTPYDLRRTFGNWLEQAGILRSRRMQYLGHAVRDVTERYERHDVTRYLVEDGATIRKWLAANLGQRATAPKPEPSPSISPSRSFSDREVPLSDDGHSHG